MKLKLFLLVNLLVVLHLSAEITHLIGVIPQSELSRLFDSRQPMENDFFDEDLTYSMSPWLWEVNAFSPSQSDLTEIFIRLDVSLSGITPFDSRQILILERLSSLWEGEVIFELNLSEEIIDSLASEKNLDAFIDQLKRYKEKNLFTGINWDLNVCETRTDFTAIETLLTELVLFEGEPLTHYYSLSRYENTVVSLQGISDFTIIKAFDFSGRHSTLENAEESIESFIVRKQYEPSTLILGVPLYGRKFRSVDPGYWSDTMTYKEIIDRYHPLPESNEEDYYYFNGPLMARQKSILCIEKDLAGMALYELQWDDEGSQCLLKALSFQRN